MNLIKKLPDEELAGQAASLRKSVVEVCVKNGAGHIAPSLSCIEILTVLYYSIMNIAADPMWENRDRLIFSKAHGCYGLYAALCDIGYISKSDWTGFYKDSFLSGCVERNLEHGIEAGCGSLGHGLPIAAGIAFGAKLQKKDYKVYCIAGDGEMQEGSNWEALQFAAKHNLDNLILIIDNNHLQAMDFIENILTVEGRKNDLEMKLKAFGCAVETCDGHDVIELKRKLEKLGDAGRDSNLPRALIAKTIKGYGLKCMENVSKFHFRIPTDEELKWGNRYE